MQIPIYLNNIDLSVNANIMYGLNNFLLFHEDASKVFDEELKMMYVNTTNVMVDCILSNYTESRPDLTLLYYPSTYDFYWFIARNIHLL